MYIHKEATAYILLICFHFITPTTYVQNMWQENDYSLKQFCNVTSDSYSSLSANKSLIHCAIVCSGNDSCAGYTYNNDSSCDLFGDDLWDYNCSSLFEEDNTTISAFVKISVSDIGDNQYFLFLFLTTKY